MSKRPESPRFLRKKTAKREKINGVWHDRRTADGHTPTFNEFSSCLRKVRYPSESVALKVAKKLIVQNSLRVHAYKCNHCGGFHLTKKNYKGVNAHPVIF